MRKIALDIGDVRIGIALSDPGSIIAGGEETFIRTKNIASDLKYIANIAKTKDCDTFVLGYPINMDGTIGERAEKVKAFGAELAKYTDIKIEYHDERWSTVSAEKMLIESGVRRENRKGVIDKVAATIILQSYLDKLNYKKGETKMSKEIDETVLTDEEEIVTLTLDDGTEEDFVVIAELDYNGKWYTYLQPADMENSDFEEDEVLIYESLDLGDGEEEFLPVEDESLLEILVGFLNEEADKE